MCKVWKLRPLKGLVDLEPPPTSKKGSGRCWAAALVRLAKCISRSEVNAVRCLCSFGSELLSFCCAAVQLEPFSWSLTFNFKLLSLCGDPVAFPNTCFVPPAVNVLRVPVAHFVPR